MKRLLSILLLIFFWVSIVGYFHIFKLFQLKIHNEIRSRVEKSISKKELTVINFSPDEKINWIREGKEFRYRNQLYDVVRNSVKNGQVTYYCVMDSKETALEHKIKKIINDSMHNDRNSNSNALSLLMSIFPTIYFRSDKDLFHCTGSYSLLFTPYLEITSLGYPRLLQRPPMEG